MRPNTAKRKLKAGQPAIGSMFTAGSPLIAEIMAHKGFDWLAVDLEHSENSLANLQGMLQAICTTPTIPLVRIPCQDVVFIKRALDLGAYGIIVPQVETAEQAEAVVKAASYPPRGFRSWGAPRGLLYGGDDYFFGAGNEILIAAMIETRRGVQNVTEIMSVDGIDTCWIGPNDLSVSFGHSPEVRELEPDVEEAIETIKQGALAAGKAAGIQLYTAEAANRRIAQGFSFIGLSTDVRYIGEGAGAMLSRVVRER
jgi:4-hydroxy-2-oxoheptanedioate aldolase